MLYLKKVLLRKEYSGIALFELCLVMSLMGMALYPILVSFSYVDRSSVVLELDRLYTVLKFIQQKALLDQKSYSVTFDLEEGSYTADRVWYLRAGVCIGFPKSFLGCTIEGPPSKPTKKLIDGCTWPNNTLVVHATGVMGAGALYLTDRIGSCLYALTVDASEVTALRRYYYDTSWHLLNG